MVGCNWWTSILLSCMPSYGLSMPPALATLGALKVIDGEEGRLQTSKTLLIQGLSATARGRVQKSIESRLASVDDHPPIYPSNLYLPFSCIHIPLKTIPAMPPPTSSLKPNAKPVKTNGASDAAAGAGEEKKSTGGWTKPDQAKYNADQDAVNKEIAAVKQKLVSLQGTLLDSGRWSFVVR